MLMTELKSMDTISIMEAYERGRPDDWFIDTSRQTDQAFDQLARDYAPPLEHDGWQWTDIVENDGVSE